MGWELELTDAVYNNDLELVRQYVKDKEIRRGLGKRERGGEIKAFATDL